MNAAVRRLLNGASSTVLAGLHRASNAVRHVGLLVRGGAGKATLTTRSGLRAAAGLMSAAAAMIRRSALRVASLLGSTGLGAIHLAAAGIGWVVGRAAAMERAATGAASSAAFAVSRARRRLAGGLHAFLANGLRLLGNRHI
jgi:hypothetical protein